MGDDLDLTNPMEGAMSIEEQNKMALELAYDEFY